MPHILVVDDVLSTLKALETILSQEGYAVTTTTSGEQALSLMRQHEIDLLLSDVKMSNMSGLELLRQVKADYPDTCVIMMSGHQDIAVAVEAIKEGAFDYLVKPMSRECTVRAVQKALTMRALVVENLILKRQVRAQFSRSEVIGSSQAWRRVRELIGHVAPSQATLLLTGESGTGKEVIATMVHRLSTRAEQAFIVLNAAALPPTLLEAELFGYEKGAFTGAHERKPGQFELADGGTLFLDEIGDMPIEIQAKLLRVLQDGTFKRLGGTRELQVDVRLITATNKNLMEEVRLRHFREDLYYRLNVIAIRLPALRERRSDIPLLASHFICHYARINHKQVSSIQPDALEALKAYDWPGNVRELENVIERAVVLCQSDSITLADLNLNHLRLGRLMDEDDYFMLPVNATMAEVERETILQALQHHAGNRQATARQLAIAPATLYRKLKEYHLR
jgi:two-component system response regulator HydG